MEILQLQYFECIAKHENVSKAAEELHVSQPSLSSSIIRLENELGTQLFDRNGRKIVLNNYGKYFLSTTRKILNLIDACKISYGHEIPESKISIAFQNFNERVLSLIERFGRENPQVSFNIYGSTLNGPFAISSYDFLIGNADARLSASLKSFTLEERGYYVLVPRSHPFAQREELFITDLREEKFCFLRNEKGDFERAYWICIENGFIPHCIFSTNVAYYKLHYLSQGMAFGFIPTGWRETYSNIPALKVIPLHGFGHMTDIQIFWSEEKAFSFATQQFLDYIKQHFIEE